MPLPKPPPSQGSQMSNELLEKLRRRRGQQGEGKRSCKGERERERERGGRSVREREGKKEVGGEGGDKG